MGLPPSRAPHHQRLVWANGDTDGMPLTAVEDNRVILARGGEVGGRGAEVDQGYGWAASVAPFACSRFSLVVRCFAVLPLVGDGGGDGSHAVVATNCHIAVALRNQ